MACDYYNVLFAIDDLTDEMDVNATSQLGYIFLDALRNPEKERPEGEHVIGEMTRR